jgi:hypothetical protein
VLDKLNWIPLTDRKYVWWAGGLAYSSSTVRRW